VISEAPRSRTRLSCPSRRGARHVVDTAVPLFADRCAIDVIGKSNAFVRIAEAPDVDSPSMSTDQDRRVETWVPSTGRAEIVAESGLPRAATTIVAPVILRRRLLGRMLFTAGARGSTSDDLLKAESFARLAAIAIENSRLRRSEREGHRGRREGLAMVAHDLRNPLGVIQLSVALLRGNARRDDECRRFAVIERNVRFMNSLVSDLLDLASARGRALRVSPAPEKVSDVVDDAVASFVVLTETRGLSFAIHHDDPDAVAFCDRKRVLQVLANLIGNAIKFSHDGGSITIATSRAGGSVRFCVTDEGSGIPVADRARIFEPFWSGTQRTDGTGLGLAIAKGIVDAHGGRIGVASARDEGSTFWFTLPTGPASCQVGGE
jgi:signal transduction histidine kinase